MADLDWWNVRPCGLSGAPDCASWCTEAASGPSEPEPAHAQLLISASPPFSILNATEAWCQLTGYSAESVFGRPVALLHGPLTCPETLAALTIAMSLGRSLRVVLVSYTSTGAWLPSTP
jgi:PAS domain-containing protein